jgi:YHS domain-containing protein
MIRALFRFVFIVFVLYLIYAVVRFFQSIGKSARSRNEQAPLQGTMVKDEFCNMYLPRSEAVREVRDGKEYFFCSDECRKKFFEANKG